jgi:hypothetical protein
VGLKAPMKRQLLSTLPPLKLADANNDRVQRFSAKGKFQLNWGQKEVIMASFGLLLVFVLMGIETRLITINKIICLSI